MDADDTINRNFLTILADKTTPEIDFVISNSQNVSGKIGGGECLVRFFMYTITNQYFRLSV